MELESTINNSQKKRTSEVWNKFQLVDEGNGVECKSCAKRLKFDSKHGTSNLKRHKCSTVQEQQAILSEEDRTKIKKAASKIITKDLRPFKTVEGAGFLEFTQEIIKVAQRYTGQLNAKEVLPSRNTVKRLTHEMADEGRQNLAQQLSKCRTFAFTTDMWTDSFALNCYLTITVHFVNDEFTLNNFVLTTQEFSDRKTAVNIKDMIDAELAKFNISRATKLYFTTDRGANICAALSDENRIDCAAHVMNTIVQTALSNSNEEIQKLLTDCKQLVRYIKKNSLQRHLENSLKQSNDTRWNSTFSMLLSIQEQYQNVVSVLAASYPDQLHRVTVIDKEMLANLIKFLEIFNHCTNYVQGDKKPTIHKVIPSFKILKQHCVKYEEHEDMDIMDLASQCRALIERKFKSNVIHAVAILLYPRKKSMNVLSEEERTAALQFVGDYEDCQPLAITLTQPRPSPTQPSLLDALDDVEVSHNDELAHYQAARIVMGCECPLEWWSKQTDQYPCLSQLARQVFSVMATSASSERLFSVAGHVINKRRTNLKPDTVDNILFLNSFQK